LTLTLAEAITSLTTRLDLDQESEIDTTDTTKMTAAIMRAAEEFSRDSYAFWTWDSALTLTANDPDYSSLNTSHSVKRIFHVYGVFINGSWLTECNPRQFMRLHPSYKSETSVSNPYDYVLTQPSDIRIAAPPNATAAAATNHLIGFCLHDLYTYAANSATELQGPADLHDLIVDRAFLTLSKSYMADEEGRERRRVVASEYFPRVKAHKALNMSIYKKEKVYGAMGQTRRIYDIGGGGFSG
jgi:hypothetical protein